MQRMLYCSTSCPIITLNQCFIHQILHGQQFLKSKICGTWSQQVAIRRSTIQQNDIQQTRFPTRQWQSTYWYQQVNIRQTKSTTNLSSIRSVANTQNVTAKVMIGCLSSELLTVLFGHKTHPTSHLVSLQRLFYIWRPQFSRKICNHHVMVCSPPTSFWICRRLKLSTRLTTLVLITCWNWIFTSFTSFPSVTQNAHPHELPGGSAKTGSSYLLWAFSSGQEPMLRNCTSTRWLFAALHNHSEQGQRCGTARHLILQLIHRTSSFVISSTDETHPFRRQKCVFCVMEKRKSPTYQWCLLVVVIPGRTMSTQHGLTFRSLTRDPRRLLCEGLGLFPQIVCHQTIATSALCSFRPTCNLEPVLSMLQSPTLRNCASGWGLSAVSLNHSNQRETLRNCASS